MHLEGGIYFQNPLPNDSSVHRYSKKNKTFKLNKTFTYEYYYMDTLHRKYKFLNETEDISYNASSWLTDYKTQNKSAIFLIKLTVNDNLKKFLSIDSSYTQTVIKYTYLNYQNQVLANEETGVVDNILNVWLHPPRHGAFKILEINPFPFVYLNDSVKNWKSALEVWESWSDIRWKIWKGLIHINYNYKREKDEILETGFGPLNCQVISAVANSEIGKTFLKNYFNPKYGFVRMEYTNIDNSKLIMELVDSN